MPNSARVDKLNSDALKEALRNESKGNKRTIGRKTRQLQKLLDEYGKMPEKPELREVAARKVYLVEEIPREINKIQRGLNESWSQLMDKYVTKAKQLKPAVLKYLHDCHENEKSNDSKNQAAAAVATAPKKFRVNGLTWTDFELNLKREHDEPGKVIARKFSRLKTLLQAYSKLVAQEQSAEQYAEIHGILKAIEMEARKITTDPTFRNAEGFRFDWLDAVQQCRNHVSSESLVVKAEKRKLLGRVSRHAALE